MATIGINTEAIIQGGRTWMSRNIVKPAKKEAFGLGKCDIGYNRIYKAFLITEALSRDNSYTQEQIQCLESELLDEIQSRENLQAITGISGATGSAAGGVSISGGIDIVTPGGGSESGG